MTVSYEVHVEGLEQAERLLRRYPQIANEELTQAHREIIPIIVGAIRGAMRRPVSRNGGVPSIPIYRGTTIDSIGGRVEAAGGGFASLGGEVRTVVDAAGSPHAIYAEMGRRPGRFPPLDAIRQWVRIKLGVPEAEASSVAFLVARKIARRGYTGYWMFARGWLRAKQPVTLRFREALKRIVRRVAGG